MGTIRGCAGHAGVAPSNEAAYSVDGVGGVAVRTAEGGAMAVCGV